MTARKKMTPEEIECRLLADSHDPDAWEPVATVGPSRSPRPIWHGQTARQEKLVRGKKKDARFADLHNQYYPRLLRFYVRTFRVTENEAAELAQQAFVRLYATLDQYRGEADLALLETIARNVGFNRVRALKSASRKTVVDIADARAKREAREHAVIGNENQSDALRRKQLYDAIAELPQGQRQAVQLWMDGFAYAEISAAISISMDAVKSRLRDAKRFLRSRLDEDDHGVLSPRTG